MIYPFRQIVKGELVGPVEGFEFDMKTECPPIGKIIRRKGKRYRRIVHLAEIYVDHNGDSPYVSSQMPLNYTPHKEAGGKFAKKGDKIGGRLCRGGEPVFESKRQQWRTEGKANDFSEHDQIKNPKLRPFRSRT